MARPGSRVAHRLNRTEYSNAIRDLLALEIDGRSFLPADDQGFGFDNNADLAHGVAGPDGPLPGGGAAGSAARRRRSDAASRVVESFNVSRCCSTQDERISEDLPFGTRGGVLDPPPVSRSMPSTCFENSAAGQPVRGAGEQVEVARSTASASSSSLSAARATGPRRGRRASESGASRSASPRRPGRAMLERDFGETHVRPPKGVGPSRLPVGQHQLQGGRRRRRRARWSRINPQGPGDTPSRRRIFVCRPRVPAGRTAAVPPRFSRRWRAVRTGGRSRAKDRADAARLLRRARAAKSFDAGIRTALERVLVDPEFLFRIEREPAGIAARYRLSRQRPRAGLAAVVLPLEQHARRRAARPGRTRAAAEPGRARRASAADVRAMPASSALVDNFAAQWLHLRNLRACGARRRPLPGVRRQPARGLPARNGAVPRESAARGPQRDRPADGELHVRERAAGASLRHPERLRKPLPAGDRSTMRTAGRPARSGQHPDGHLVRDSHVAGRAGQMAAREHSRRAAAAASCQRAARSRKAMGRTAAPLSVRERMEEHRKNPVCSSCHARMDPLGFRARELRRDRQVAGCRRR